VKETQNQPEISNWSGNALHT